MANQKVPQLPVLSAVTGDDLFYVVDVSDTTDDPTGSSKQITRDEILTNVNQIDFNPSGSTSPTGGTVYYDYNENALSYKPITNQNDVTVNLGQETLIKIYNGLGSQINNGQVVHITGATGGVPTVALANASKLGATFTDSLAQSTGVATHDIPSGEYGFITFFGIVRDLNTTAFTVGQEVFLSDTVDGGLTNDPNNIAFTSRVSTVGYCLESNATTGKILVSITNENPLQSLTQQEVNVLLGNTISTGAYSFTGITTASTTTINVAPMRGWVVYNTYEYSTSPLVLNVNYSGGTNVGITNIGSADATYLLVNSGGTLYQQTTFPSPQERRENIFLGKVVHPNRSTILAINNTVDYDVSPMSSLRDLWTPIKIINDGVLVTPNGSNLNINTSSGTLWSNGIGWVTNELNPNSVTISAKVPASFFYRTQTGGTSSAVTVIDPTKYDVGGVITSVGGAASNDATNQRVYLYPTGTINVLYGQTVYNTLSEAVAGIQSETFVVYPNAKTTGVLIGIISVRNDIVADGEPLTNTDYAIFTPVSKFGELLGGTAGLSTTTLQQAYNNSTTPEITTNSTLGPLSIKNGAGTADNITSLIEFLNTSGSVTAFVRADGSISATTISATTVTATTISATTYYGSGTNLTGVVKGSGTANYLPKWTGTTGLGNSIIQENGGNIGIGITPTSAYKIRVFSLSTAIYGFSQGGTNYFGVIGSNIGDETGTYVGMYGYGTAADTSYVDSIYVGGKFEASGSQNNLNYAGWFMDGTEALNKVLISATADGKTNWSSNLTGLTSVSATSISATTYYNLPVDPNYYTTAFTYSNNVFTISQSGQSDLTAIINSVTGWTVNGNLTVTGNTSVQSMTGTSGTFSGSGQNVLTVVGSGNSTTPPIFIVQGSQGQLLSVTDSLTGLLDSVNNISGLPIFQVYSDNTILMGDYQAPSLNTTAKVTLSAGTNSVYSIPTNSGYTGAFFDYTVISSGNTGARAGTIMSIWSGTTAQYTDVSTNDIGDTSGISFSVAVSGTNAVLSSSATTAGWTLKTIIRSI
jgi:hypothetical protein